MDEKDKKLIIELKRRFSSDIEKHVKKIIVFGSRVKEEADEDSDLDIVALIDEKNPDIVKSLEDTAYQIMWDHDFKPVISLKVFVESEFIDAVNKGFSFYKNVLKEGIVV